MCTRKIRNVVLTRNVSLVLKCVISLISRIYLHFFAQNPKFQKIPTGFIQKCKQLNVNVKVSNIKNHLLWQVTNTINVNVNNYFCCVYLCLVVLCGLCLTSHLSVVTLHPPTHPLSSVVTRQSHCPSPTCYFVYTDAVCILNAFIKLVYIA